MLMSRGDFDSLFGFGGVWLTDWFTKGFGGFNVLKNISGVSTDVPV
jgi:hypothetical protein